MVNKICCLLAMVLSAPASALCLDKMLTPKERKGSRAGRMIFWTGSYILMAVAKIILGSSVGVLAASAVYIIGTVVILRQCYQESMLEKAIAWVTLVAFTVLGDGISTVIYCLLCGERLAVDYSSPQTAAACVLGLFIVVLLYILAMMIWDKIYKKRNSAGNTGILLLICLLPVCILIMGMQVSFRISDGLEPYVLVYSILVIMSIMIVFMLLIQNDRAAKQKELTETLRQSELERAHYTAIEEKREALARIRHDYRNVLNTAQILIESGNQQKAKQLLADLTEKINATSEYPFCAVPVINAVLTEKKTICDEQGILLRTELLLPEILMVDDFDLCIILGNLIDNAVRACGGKTDYSPEIVLSVGVVQGYLVVRCENPVLPETEEKKGTGYGQKILKSLAEKYHGNFLTQKQAGRYTAQISLFLEQSGETGAKTGETGKRGNSINMIRTK